MNHSLFDISGYSVVITGGGGVLGGALAKGFAEAGAHVAVVGLTYNPLERVVNEIRDAGGKAMAQVADVLQQEQLEEARESVLKEFGKIDILINAAGGNMAGATIGPDQTFFDLSIPDFNRVLQLNLTGSVLPSYVFGKAMAQKGEGSILNFSSMTAQQPFTRVIGYSAAKAGIDNFTKWLAVEMADKYGEKIRVNALAPGVFIGSQNRRLLLDDQNQLTARGKTIIEHTPMRRFGEAEELIGTAIWLSSPAAAFVTGIVVPIDGGFSAFSGV